ncbi:Peptidyl-prolyl cis-trans isomerase FKBP4 [Schistosoma japonicum]|uniref:Peptidyl-prolyl cis-trans isomerase FKBP4 n=1 Tax=Schistosoma japonicum TaxID=6182 RepID=Q5DFZ5_SCHJA|nr:SJCHGC06147 protein [Schistosoma japonicum]KAH8853422.1 Peptidyl-prolyl cis-trans isomerase FKBP5 [Schistosoma japonicum]TNN19714.1 Peptidyl-prolyl cis-trans isomerase FKBP4 [Schistosoma japonicum]
MKVVDDIVQDMGCGEQCEVTLTSDYEFTDSERSFLKISDECFHKILFNIYLEDIQKLAEFWQMSESEKFIIADVMKCRGNKLLKAGLLIRAFHCYKKAIRILEGSISVTNHDCTNLAIPDSESSKPTPRQLLAICLSNAAHCLFQSGTTCDTNLKKSQFDYLSACIKCCKRAVSLEPNYMKAWFRMAKTHALLGNYEEAITAGEKCLSRSTNENISESKWINVDERTKTYITNKIKTLLSEWRVSLTNEEETERSIIRKRTIKKYSSFGDWCCDELDEIEKLPISIWSNDLAENMMSLHEELEAFGEKMPEIKACRTKSKGRLKTIQDEDTDEESFEQNIE